MAEDQPTLNLPRESRFRAVVIMIGPAGLS
jgi:hypothetical protein